jgi:hypothetical protein
MNLKNIQRQKPEYFILYDSICGLLENSKVNIARENTSVTPSSQGSGGFAFEAQLENTVFYNG